MARRSKAARRLRQKSSMGFIYLARPELLELVGLVAAGRSEVWRTQSGSEGTVERRLLKRFSGRQGMGGHMLD
jgi:hypothetical protein